MPVRLVSIPRMILGKFYDPIDQKNLYLAVKKNARLVGFIGPTQNYCGGWAEGRAR